jgi:methanogenic corrinoid protein MtbC1
VSIDTLRTWERRYGFPTPERKPSGHRVYSLEHVTRLRRIAEALARGNRAGDVIAASDQELRDLLTTGPGRTTAVASSDAAHAGEDLDVLMGAVERFDGAEISKVLLAAWGRLGPCEFLDTCVAPFLEAVGDAWENDRISIRHEHFASERVSDVLRTLRGPLETRATGPLTVLATLPGELHGLGLQMAALIITAGGSRVLPLGPQVPIDEIVTLANDFGARAVGVSISASSKGATATRRLRSLRQKLPRRTELLVGGAGAPKSLSGALVMPTLATLDQWTRRTATHDGL